MSCLPARPPEGGDRLGPDPAPLLAATAAVLALLLAVRVGLGLLALAGLPLGP